jgi:hypothetical protein
MIKVIRHKELADYKPQKPVQVVPHTYAQALEKTLDMMALGHAFNVAPRSSELARLLQTKPNKAYLPFI